MEGIKPIEMFSGFGLGILNSGCICIALIVTYLDSKNAVLDIKTLIHWRQKSETQIRRKFQSESPCYEEHRDFSDWDKLRQQDSVLIDR